MDPIALIAIAALSAVPDAGARPAVPPSPELPARLTLPDALGILQERGLDLLLADAAVVSAEGDVRVAGAIPNPTVSGSYGHSFLYGGCTGAECPSYPPFIAAGLSDNAALESSLSGKRGLRRSVARAALEASQMSRDDALRTVSSLVKQQFVQVLLAQEALRFTREVAQSWTRAFELMSARYRAGAISEADLARVEVAKLEADQAVDTAMQTLRTAQVTLAQLLGVRGVVPEYAVEAPDLLHYARPGRLAQAAPPSLYDLALANRPDLKAARLQRQRAESALALARRLRFPDITLSVAYSQQGTTPSAVTPPTVTFGVSLPIPVFYQQQGEILKAEADVRTQALTAAKVESTVASDVGSGYAGFAATESLVRRMEGGLLERARRARDLVAIQYQKGAASLLDYLDAQRTYIATNVEYLTDLGNYWTSVFKLEQAVGVELR